MTNLWSEILARAWMAWLLVALLSALAEVTLPYFTFVFASVASLVAAVVAIRFSFGIQVLAFAVGMVISLTLIRPKLMTRFQRVREMPSRSQALVGAKGVVTEAIEDLSGRGRVTVLGQDWAAKSASPVLVGCSVEIVSHDGIVLIVKEI